MSPAEDKPQAAAPAPAVPRHKALAEAALWVVPAIWSSNYLIARVAAPLVPPHLLAFGRWGVVLAVLLAWRAPALWRQRAALRAEAPQLLVLGALGMWICGAWVYLGGRSTSVANIGLIYAIAPVGIAIGGARLLREPLAPRQMAAMAAALAGVLVVVFRGDPAAVARLEFTAGDLWIVAATASWIAYSLLLRAWASALGPVDRLCGICAGGLLCLAPFTWHEVANAPGPLPAAAWGLILLAGLLPGLASYLAYAFMQRELGVARAGLVMYLAPVYGALLSWLFLGEPPHWFHLLGALFILPGIRYSAPAAPRSG
ncbi:MAG: DMT family transporter [Rubrivivax sp.]